MVGASASGLFNATAFKKRSRRGGFHLSGRRHNLRCDNEDLMDAVTAVSGSGPAYFFLLMEEMIKTGVKLGLDSQAAADLVIQTACGAALLAQKGQQSSQTPEILAKTSPAPAYHRSSRKDISGRRISGHRKRRPDRRPQPRARTVRRLKTPYSTTIASTGHSSAACWAVLLKFRRNHINNHFGNVVAHRKHTSGQVSTHKPARRTANFAANFHFRLPSDNGVKSVNCIRFFFVYFPIIRQKMVGLKCFLWKSPFF